MADREPSDRTVPRWVAPAFLLAAFATVPWIGYLAATLPRTARIHERTAWVGFDIGLVLLLALTGFLAWRGRPRVALAAVATATMLVMDAWFDVLTSRRGVDRDVAIGLGVLELTLAGVCLWISLHAAAVTRRRYEYLERRDRRRRDRVVAEPPE
jgi:hypothetical protein